MEKELTQLIYDMKLLEAKETDEGTELKILIPGRRVANQIARRKGPGGITGDVLIEDPRMVTHEQREKIMAIIGDISEWSGHDRDILRRYLTLLFCYELDIDEFSLSQRKPGTASLEVGRLFITFLINFCFQLNIPTYDTMLNRTEDMASYFYLCIKHKKCVLCQKHADIHHEDAIGMGNDRKTLDDSKHKKIALCREHHNIAHNMGIDSFRMKYKVFGIIVDEEDFRDWKEIG